MKKKSKEILINAIVMLSFIIATTLACSYILIFIKIYDGGFWDFFGSLILAFIIIVKNLFWPYLYFCGLVAVCWFLYFFILLFKNILNDNEKTKKKPKQQKNNQPSD